MSFSGLLITLADQFNFRRSLPKFLFPSANVFSGEPLEVDGKLKFAAPRKRPTDNFVRSVPFALGPANSGETKFASHAPRAREMTSVAEQGRKTQNTCTGLKQVCSAPFI